MADAKGDSKGKQKSPATAEHKPSKLAISKMDPKFQKATSSDLKGKLDRKPQKPESDAKVKFDAKANKRSSSDNKGNVVLGAQKATVDAKSKLDPKDLKELDARGKPSPTPQSRLEKIPKEKSEPDQVADGEGPELPEEAPYVNPFKIENVYARYLQQHPPPKPWSFDMRPPRRAIVKPILDPFKWSKTYVHPWGDEKVKAPETIAEEKRLAKLEADRLAKKYIRPCEPGEHHHKRVSVYCQPHRDPIYKLDIHGNPKLDEAGNPIFEPIFMLNSHGSMLLDGQGNPVPVYLLDSDGNVQLDPQGKPKPGPTYMLDAKGDALLDQAGNLIPEPEHVDFLDAEGNVVLDEHGLPRHESRPVFMLDAKGHVMLDKDGNRILGRFYRDVEGDVVMTAEGKPVHGRFLFGELDDEGQVVRDPEGDIILDPEGIPILERQETEEGKKFRLTAVLWRKLHEHVTYLQNPRYAADLKQFKVIVR